MTKSETDNIKEEIHAPVKYFESKSSCKDVDISNMTKSELVLIVDRLPQRGKKHGVMSLSAKGDVVFISNTGEDMFFCRDDIGDMWSFVHKRLLLIIAMGNERKSHDLHFFAMHRRRGVDLVFKLRKMVADERMEMMRMMRNQERVAAQLKMIQNALNERDDRLKLMEQEPGYGREIFTDTESKGSEISGAFISPPHPSSPQLGRDLWLSKTSSLPQSSTQSSPDSGSSWFDILSGLNLDANSPSGDPAAFHFLRQNEEQMNKSFQPPQRNTGSCGRNPFREMDEHFSAYQITNPFILSAVLNCFNHRHSPLEHSHSIRSR